MKETGHPLTAGGRVNEAELVRIDAAALLKQQPRAHFIVEAALERATQVIQEAAEQTV